MKNRYLPFGYKIADGKIVADSEQVEVVRRIFDAYTAGQTFQQIADVMSAQGIYSSRTACSSCGVPYRW